MWREMLEFGLVGLVAIVGLDLIREIGKSYFKVSVNDFYLALFFIGVYFAAKYASVKFEWYFIKDTNKSFTEKKLMCSTQDGEVIRLKDINDFLEEIVCTLGPYQNSVTDKCPQAERINKHLRSVNYVGDQAHWSLVFANNLNVTIYTFKRRPDLFEIHWLTDQQMQGMPINFTPSDWAEAEQAGFFRLSVHGFPYLLFGRVR